MRVSMLSMRTATTLIKIAYGLNAHSRSFSQPKVTSPIASVITGNLAGLWSLDCEPL
ncbi:hypothetical protein CRG98_042851 [Punica granatum]|uniref:Uncharacterized protein n=1 Tax=Punica granatum TaxID=22663 RepID=A0A2I0HYI0_PUNGR|nr:hypothetical protein CRG98_042851 [Punica granatum]